MGAPHAATHAQDRGNGDELNLTPKLMFFQRITTLAGRLWRGNDVNCSAWISAPDYNTRGQALARE
jgi:hypothetical protein